MEFKTGQIVVYSPKDLANDKMATIAFIRKKNEDGTYSVGLSPDGESVMVEAQSLYAIENETYVEFDEMINLGEPSYGWENLRIGNKTFSVSYLSDLWSELDVLFLFPPERDLDYLCVNRIILEGETEGDLFLTAYRTVNSQLVIIWEEPYTNSGESVVMYFDYNKFMEQYMKEKERIGLESYKKKFLMEYHDYSLISLEKQCLCDFETFYRKWQPKVDVYKIIKEKRGNNGKKEL